MHRTFCIPSILLLLIVALTGLVAQQLPSSIPQVSQHPSTPGTPDNDSGVPSDMQKKMQKKANEQRQAELKKDTEKLLKLSTELKQSVDKSNENILSLDVIKKAEEIEKLAHSVKMKMRGDQYGASLP